MYSSVLKLCRFVVASKEEDKLDQKIILHCEQLLRNIRRCRVVLQIESEVGESETEHASYASFS